MKYLLLGRVRHDGGHESDWSEPIREEISAKDDKEAFAKARKIVRKKYEKIKNDQWIFGMEVNLYGPPLKRFYSRQATPAEPAIPAIKARKATRATLIER